MAVFNMVDHGLESVHNNYSKHCNIHAYDGRQNF